MKKSSSYTEVCKDTHGRVKHFFNINEEKRIIVAIIPNRRFNVVDDFYHFTQKFRRSCGLPDIRLVNDYPFDPDERLLIPNKFIGIAKCSLNDTFDVEYGKKLALARARMNMAHAQMHTFYRFVEYIDEFSYSLGKRYDKLCDNFYAACDTEAKIEKEKY